VATGRTFFLRHRMAMRTDVKASGSFSGELDGAHEDFIKDIYDEMFLDPCASRDFKCSKLFMADEQLSHLDGVELQPGDFTVDVNNKRMSTAKRITASKSVKIARLVVRRQDDRNRFITPITPVDVVQGNNYVVTWNVVAETRHRISSGLGKIVVNDNPLIEVVFNRMAGLMLQDVNTCLDKVEYNEGSRVLLSVPLSKDRTARRANHAPTNFSADGTLTSIYLYTKAGLALIAYAVHPGVPVTTGDKASYSLTVTVS